MNYKTQEDFINDDLNCNYCEFIQYIKDLNINNSEYLLTKYNQSYKEILIKYEKLLNYVWRNNLNESYLEPYVMYLKSFNELIKILENEIKTKKIKNNKHLIYLSYDEVIKTLFN